MYNQSIKQINLLNFQSYVYILAPFTSLLNENDFKGG